MGRGGELALVLGPAAGDGRWRGTVLTPGRRAPGPPVRGEDPVVAAARRRQVPGRHHGQAGRHGQVQPVRPAVAFQVQAAAGGVAGYVVGDVDGVRVGAAASLMASAAGSPFLIRRSAPRSRRALAEVREGVCQEAEPVRRGGDRGIDDERRHHLPGAAARQVQRRVVVQPEITREQHDRGFHLPSLRSGREKLKLCGMVRARGRGWACRAACSARRCGSTAGISGFAS